MKNILLSILKFMKAYKATLGIITYFLVLALITIKLTKNDSSEESPKFKVGDCLRYFIEANEFEEAHLLGRVREVYKVGKKSYLLDAYDNDLKEVVPFFMQDRWAKVDCKTGEPL